MYKITTFFLLFDLMEKYFVPTLQEIGEAKHQDKSTT